MTIGELRAALEGRADDEEVVVSSTGHTIGFAAAKAAEEPAEEAVSEEILEEEATAEEAAAE